MKQKTLLFVVVLLIAPVFVLARPTAPFRRLSAAANAPGMQHLTGEDARLFLQQLSDRHPGVVQKSAAMLRQKGWRDTGHMEVIRSVAQVHSSLDSASGPYWLTDGSVAGSGGEIAWWTWDTGNDTTWGGYVYLHEYSSGNWVCANMETSMIPYQEFTLVWDEPTGAGTDGDGGGIINPTSLGTQRSTPLIFASYVDRGPIHRVNWIDWSQVRRGVQNWAWCTSFGCAGSYIGCVYMMPGKLPKEVAECAAGTCIAIGIGCLYVLVSP